MHGHFKCIYIKVPKGFVFSSPLDLPCGVTVSMLYLQESKRNVLKDFVHIAGPLGVTHFLILTATENACYLRISKAPRVRPLLPLPVTTATCLLGQPFRLACYPFVLLWAFLFFTVQVCLLLLFMVHSHILPV